MAGGQEADGVHHKGGVPLTATASLELTRAAASMNAALLRPSVSPLPIPLILVGCTDALGPCHVD